MSSWADLRQVVLASTDPERVAGELRTHLGLGAGFGDPELAEHGIADDTMAVGASTYLEVVSPLTDDHPLAHWLARQGGSAGYLLSIQVSDIEACLARCAADGIRTTHTQLVQGHRIAQLHPGDMAINAEIDGIAERGTWFWDALPVDRRADALVDDIVAVDVAVDDPTAVSGRWARVLGLPLDDASTVHLGARVVRFVPRVDRKGICRVELRAVDRATGPGATFVSAGIEFALV